MKAAADPAVLDVEAVRRRFPALNQLYNGRPAIFLDNPGGTQVPESVIAAVSGYYTSQNANDGAVYETGLRTMQVIREAHSAAAEFLGSTPDEVVFGPNMTSLTFHLSRSLACEIGPGDEIVVSRLDHDANIAPWLLLARDTGATARWAEIRPEDCTLDMRQTARLIGPRTRLVAVGYASNSAGTVNDVKTIVGWARQAGALSFIDAVHYAPHGPIDVKDLGCDFLACSPYKFFGPHFGILYGKRRHLERLPAYKVRPAPEELPYRWETGTQNHEGMAGVIACIDHLAWIGSEFGGADPSASRPERLSKAWPVIRRHERLLAGQLLEGIISMRGVRLYGIQDPSRLDQRVATFILRKKGRTPLELAQALAERNIFAWHGNYYALAPSLRLGVEESGGWLRVGMVHYNTAEEVERFLEVLDGL